MNNMILYNQWEGVLQIKCSMLGNYKNKYNYVKLNKIFTVWSYEEL